jgi:hypothetical protein
LNQATVRTIETKGMPAAAEMLEPSGTHSLEDAQATTMTQATTVIPRSAEMPETVLTPTTYLHRNSWKTRQKAKFREKIQRKRVTIILFCPIGFS